MNKVFLVGNLTKDPELRYTQSGKATARMSIAINQGYGDKQTTDFFNLIAWEKTAELCDKFLSKGSKILVDGRLKNNNYEKDGVKHYGVDVIVISIEFLDKKKFEQKNNVETDDNDDIPF